MSGTKWIKIACGPHEGQSVEIIDELPGFRMPISRPAVLTPHDLRRRPMPERGSVADYIIHWKSLTAHFVGME